MATKSSDEGTALTSPRSPLGLTNRRARPFGELGQTGSPVHSPFRGTAAHSSGAFELLAKEPSGLGGEGEEEGVGGGGGGGEGGPGFGAVAREGGRESGEPLVGRRELWAWWLYDAASSAFNSFIISSIFPLTLELLANKQAWFQQYGRDAPPDCGDKHANNCVKCVAGKGSKLLVDGSLQTLPRRRVHLGALDLDPAAYATFTLAVAIICQVAVSISLGPLADFGRFRKHTLLWGSAVGFSAVMAGVALSSRHLWWLAGVLVIVASCAYGIAWICYLRYLAVLVDNTPEVREAEAAGVGEVELYKVKQRTENRVALAGIATGNVGVILLVILVFAIALIPNISDLLLLRLSLLLGGIWWALLTLPLMRWVHPRPGPPLPPGGLSLLTGWRNLTSTVAEARAFPHAFRFVIAYFLYADGYNTISTVGVLFGQRDLCMSTGALIGVVVTAALCAAIGAKAFDVLHARTGWSNKTMVELSLCVMALIPLYGCLGFFTPEGSLGLKHPWELFMVAAVFGLSQAGMLGFSRTCMVDFTPRGKEAVFFSLFSVSDKGSGILGPLVISIVAQSTGQLRFGLIFILCVLVIPTVFLHLFVDDVQGVKDAGRSQSVNHMELGESNESINQL